MVRDGTAPVEVRALVPGTAPPQPVSGGDIFVQAGALDAANAARLRTELQGFFQRPIKIIPTQVKGSSCIVFVLVLWTPSQWPIRW